MSEEKVILDGESLTPEAVMAIARRFAPVEASPAALKRVARCRAVVEKLVEADASVYGLTTGFGSLRDVKIASANVHELQRNLIRSHSCGVGAPAPEDVVRAMLLLRANTLVKGFSGVRALIIECLVQMLNRRVYPVVPLKGSVGASGDLAPLSHLALVLIGEGEAFLGGQIVPGSKAMEAAGVQPVVLEAKEGLALNNGTQFMTAIGVLALRDAECAVRASILGCGLSLEAIKGVRSAFEERIHAVRPHPGQAIVAAAIRRQTEHSEILELPVNTARLLNAQTFLAAAQVILANEDSERCRTATQGIEGLRTALAKLMLSLGERIESEVARLPSGRDNGDLEDESSRQAGARLLAEHVATLQGIFEQVLSAALPNTAVGAREHLRRALGELQGAVAPFVPVQDDYSFRCAPQVIGPAIDTLQYVRRVLCTELNAATDNPLIFPPKPASVDIDLDDYVRDLTVSDCKRAVVSGGNFHGEPVAVALDQACIALAEVGSISERRTFHLVSRHLSNGLPPFLIRDVGLKSGLMVAQYTAAALVSENKTLCHPASVDSIPTCEDAEDHVSMGAYAARKFAEVVDNVLRVVAIELICAAQGVELRRPTRPSPANEELLRTIRRECRLLSEDRPIGSDIERVASIIRERAFEPLV